MRRGELALRLIPAVLFPLFLVFAGQYLSSTGLFRMLELRSLDLRFKARGELPTDPSILLVGADESSFSSLGVRYPFPPLLYADLIRSLRDAGASVIGFDFLYSEPTRECDPPDQDRLLAEVIAEEPDVVWGIELEDGTRPIDPIDVINEAVADTGFLNLPDEIDSRIRRFRMEAAGRVSFDAAVLRQYAGFLPEEWKGEDLHLINYRGPAGSFDTVSMSDVLRDRVPPERIQNRICLVGAMFVASHDCYATPFHSTKDRDMYGVEIHANILSTVLQGAKIRVVDALPVWGILLILSLTLLVLQAAGRMWWSLALWFVFCFGWIGVTVAAFLSDWRIPLAMPLLVLTATFWPGAFYTYLLERKRRKRVRSLFSSYVDPTVVAWLLKHPERINVAGERRMVTILDTDIEGFTTITQKLDPTDLVQQLNEYFEQITDAALTEGGMHDKYVGDALMVVYGFPMEQPDHAERALRAGEEILKRVDKLNERWRIEGLPEFNTRIGICSGEVIMGNVGGTRRKTVTAMGDAANLASRLEGLNKQFGTRILIAQSTMDLLPEETPLADMGEVSVRGYDTPIRVFHPAFDRPPRATIIAQKPSETPRGPA